MTNQKGYKVNIHQINKSFNSIGLTPYGRRRNKEIEADSVLIQELMDRHGLVPGSNFVSLTTAQEAYKVLNTISSKGLMGVDFYIGEYTPKSLLYTAVFP